MRSGVCVGVVLGLLAIVLPCERVQGYTPSFSVIVAGHAQSTHSELNFTVPIGWVKDEKAAKKLGIEAVIVPAGQSMESADAAITISFDKKDATTEGRENLKSYFAYDMRQTLAQAPGAKFAR